MRRPKTRAEKNSTDLRATERTRDNLTSATADTALPRHVDLAMAIVLDWLEAETRRLKAPKRRLPANVVPFVLEGGVL